jgi:hypothetical protein
MRRESLSRGHVFMDSRSFVFWRKSRAPEPRDCILLEVWGKLGASAWHDEKFQFNVRLVRIVLT